MSTLRSKIINLPIPISKLFAYHYHNPILFKYFPKYPKTLVLCSYPSETPIAFMEPEMIPVLKFLQKNYNDEFLSLSIDGDISLIGNHNYFTKTNECKITYLSSWK